MTSRLTKQEIPPSLPAAEESDPLSDDSVSLYTHTHTPWFHVTVIPSLPINFPRFTFEKAGIERMELEPTSVGT